MPFALGEGRTWSNPPLGTRWKAGVPCGSWDVHWMLGQARVKTDPPRIPSFSPRELQRAADRASNLCPGVASNLGGRTSMPVVYACGRCGYSRAVGANEETGLPSERTRPKTEACWWTSQVAPFTRWILGGEEGQRGREMGPASSCFFSNTRDG